MTTIEEAWEEVERQHAVHTWDEGEVTIDSMNAAVRVAMLAVLDDLERLAESDVPGLKDVCDCSVCPYLREVRATIEEVTHGGK